VSGRARHYAFDAGGHRMAFDDALNVFRSGLADQSLSPGVETLYETAARRDLESAVVFNMYARGAQTWIKPGLDDWREFFSFGESFGISSERYDQRMMEEVIRLLESGERPDLLSIYFWGLDHDSHVHGPLIQYPYLTETIDPLVGQLLGALERHAMMEGTLFVLYSDHGQIEVPNDSEHCMVLAFPPLDIGLGHVFKGIRRNVLDRPRETRMDTVLSMNGALSHVYARRKIGRWRNPPSFSKDILPIAAAFWEGVTMGTYYPPLFNALSMILVRDCEKEGWQAPYQAYTPQGCIPIEAYLAGRETIETVDMVNRLDHLACANSGDILLLSNIEAGFYFAFPYRGVHGSLNPQDSTAVLIYGLPGGSSDQVQRLRSAVDAAIQKRCAAENSRRVNIADIKTGVLAAMGWD
jgi:hypothetical protein